MLPVASTYSLPLPGQRLALIADAQMLEVLDAGIWSHHSCVGIAPPPGATLTDVMVVLEIGEQVAAPRGRTSSTADVQMLELRCVGRARAPVRRSAAAGREPVPCVPFADTPLEACDILAAADYEADIAGLHAECRALQAAAAPPLPLRFLSLSLALALI